MGYELNRGGDGPFAWTDPAALDQIEATGWLIECVEDNNAANGASWSDWDGADDIVSVYTREDKDGDEYELDPGTRGRTILERAIAGGDAHALLDEWTMERYGR